MTNMQTDNQILVQMIAVLVEKRDRTRDIQWKVNIGLWGLLVAALYAGLTSEHLDRLPSWTTCLMLFFLPLHLTWALIVQNSLRREGAEIDRLKRLVLSEDKSDAGADFGAGWIESALWVLIQVSVTTLLVVGAVVVLI